MANLEQLLELNTKYQDSYGQLEKILLDILEAGEVTQSNLEDMQSKFEQETEYYNCLKQMQQTQNDMTLQEQIDELRDTKLDISVDSIIDLLTNGGRSSAISVGENGSIILDAASIEELNQVRFTVDEQNKRIESVIADTEVEQEDGTKVKLKVLFSTLDQKVDGVTTTVGQIEGIANDANSKAEGALTAASQIEQKVDRITTTVQGYETAINKGVVKVDNEFYISTSKESLVGGSWTSTTPTTISDGKYLWIRPVYTLKDGTKSQGTPVCTSGAKGDQGPQGPQGETGNGIDHILTIYFVSTSKTTAPTFAEYGWVLDIPAYVESNYLWSAYKIWYTDGTVGFTTPQYCSEWEANNKAEKAVSVATQTNDMFNWIVKKGSSSSSITLTDATISAIANSSIKLKASQITLEGLVTANNNFKILADGSIEAVNAKFTGDITGSTFSSRDGSFTVGADGRAEVDSLSVNGEFSTDVLTVNEINNSRYQPVLDEDVIIYIDPLGVASDEFTNYSTFTSIAQFMDMCPQNLNGHDVTLHFINNVSENIYFTKFHSGRIVFSLNSKILLGYMYVSGYGMQYEFSPNNNGKIMPNTAYLGDNGNYSVFAYNTSLRIQDVTIYAGNGSGNNNGIELSNFANGKIDNVSFVNCYNAVRAYVCSRAYITNTKGQAASFTFYSLSGSVLAFGSAPNASSKGGAGYRYAVASNGQCLVEGADFSAGAVSGTNTNTSTGTTTKTVTITSDYGDTYRKTVYNNWKKDGTVRQGDYGYGDCVGCWFFGTKLSNYANMNVSKIVITFTRQSGGVSTTVTHGVRTHNYATRPSGSPSFNSNFSKSVSVGVGGTGTITLTSSTDIKNFLAAKGIGLVPASQTSSYYSVCSGTCKVKITYTA